MVINRGGVFSPDPFLMTRIARVVWSGIVLRYDALALSALENGMLVGSESGGASLVSNSIATCFMRRAASSEIAPLALSTLRIAASPL